MTEQSTAKRGIKSRRYWISATKGQGNAGQALAKGIHEMGPEFGLAFQNRFEIDFPCWVEGVEYQSRRVRCQNQARDI